MERAPVVILATLLVIAVAGTSAAGKPKPKRDWQAETGKALEAFRDCAFASADARVSSTAAPADIADAALHECAAEYRVFRELASDWFASSVSWRNEVQARRDGEVRAAESQEKVRRAVISRVLTAREQSGQSQTAKKPSSVRTAALDVFFDCAFAAEQLGTQTPAEQVADAALLNCHSEYDAFRAAALRSAQASKTSDDPQGDAESLAKIARESIRESLIKTIVEARKIPE